MERSVLLLRTALSQKTSVKSEYCIDEVFRHLNMSAAWCVVWSL